MYDTRARWLLVSALCLGYIMGHLIHIPDLFVAGGVLLNALRYELPKREHLGYFLFAGGALLYTVVILGVGQA